MPLMCLTQSAGTVGKGYERVTKIISERFMWESVLHFASQCRSLCLRAFGSMLAPAHSQTCVCRAPPALPSTRGPAVFLRWPLKAAPPWQGRLVVQGGSRAPIEQPTFFVLVLSALGGGPVSALRRQEFVCWICLSFSALSRIRMVLRDLQNRGELSFSPCTDRRQTEGQTAGQPARRTDTHRRSSAQPRNTQHGLACM